MNDLALHDTDHDDGAATLHAVAAAPCDRDDLHPADGAAAALYDVASALYDRDDFRRAADLFRYVALTTPTFAHAWWGLGACHERLEDHGTAAILYETGYRLGGEDVPELALLCARARLADGDAEGASAVLEELDHVGLGDDLRRRRDHLADLAAGGVR